KSAYEKQHFPAAPRTIICRVLNLKSMRTSLPEQAQGQENVSFSFRKSAYEKQHFPAAPRTIICLVLNFYRIV
ncbi:MAG: hypothetical protein WCJ46_01945, partial [bacterium]